MFDSFFIGLQFLTRISIVKQSVWTEESFGKSVKYFPAVGAVLGLVYAIIAEIINLLNSGVFPMLTAAIILISMTILTGGIHCDGFMDTMDGLFSGRDRDKMLEIMKDSRVGAFGVVSFTMLSILDFAALSELSSTSSLMLIAAIYSAPIIGRMMMVVIIGNFSYARPEGMGKAFAEYTTQSTVALATIETLILLLPLIFLSSMTIKPLSISMVATLIFTMYFGKFATKKIGGVTGDIYGAVEIVSEALVMVSFLINC